MSEVFGTVFDVQHFSVSDGPGIRTTVFFKGCPLRCLWCHNPESLSPDPQPLLHAEKCVLCGRCAEVCPAHCHSVVGGEHYFESKNCTGCGACAAACLPHALQIAGKRVSAREVFREVYEDRYFYEASGGGMTLSGGEPLFQPEFAVALCTLAKENGLNVAVETSGFGRAEDFRTLCPLVDLFLFDYKCANSNKHKAFTGADNHRILENLDLLNGMGAKIILRCPIIPGKNDDEEHIRGIAGTARRYSGIVRIDLEPYHSLGVSKREGIGTPCVPVSSPPSSEAMRTLAKTLEETACVRTVVL